MHELYNLEKTALEEYAAYNFPKGAFSVVLCLLRADFFFCLNSNQYIKSFCEHNFVLALFGHY